MIHWLVSYPRSGNTWVRVFLDAYRYGRADINDLQATRGDSNPALLKTAKPFETLSAYEWACVRLGGLQEMAEDSPIVKTHNCNARILDVPIIPDGLSGPSVYLIRDPRDVAVSFAHHLCVDYDKAIDRMIDQCASSKPKDGERPVVHEIRSSWDRHVASWESRKYCIVVRYEDLLQYPQREFGRILKQYGLENDSAKRKNAIALSSFESLRSVERANGFREGGLRGQTFFRKGIEGGWKSELTKDQSARIEDSFRDTMERYGYEIQAQRWNYA